MSQLAPPQRALAPIARLRGQSPGARTLRYALYGVAYWLVLRTVLFSSPALLVHGAAVGILYGLMAVGLILVYRTNRVINFAVASIGAVPATLALILLTNKGVPYPLTALIAVAGGLAVGGVVDVLVIRRFADSPRLILTVATLGVSQALAGVALLIALWLVGGVGLRVHAETPWTSELIRDASGSPILRGDQLFALVVVIALALGLEAFLRRTRLGIALRASAEGRDRALLLGIPVARVQTVSWMIAGLFGALTLFLRAPLTGLPLDGTLGPGVLLYALAAAAIARFDDVPVALLTGVAVGVLEQASVAETGTPNLAYALMLGVVLVALVLHRNLLSRAFASGMSTWRTVKEQRPIPLALRGLPEVRAAKVVALALGATVAVVAPTFVTAGEVGKLTLIPLYAIVAVSMVVLAGWAGQVSMGQFGIVGAGAAVAAGLAANHNLDFFVVLVTGCLAGAAVSVVLGLPAVRVRGIYLAVVTLAFAGAMQFYFLDPRYVLARVGVLPRGEAARVERPWLWGGLDLGDDRTFYYLCLVFLGLVLLGARALRRYRSGRIFIAARDNEGSAAAYGVNVAATRLAAFAIAGAIAALAGVLFAYQQQAVDPSTYGIVPSLEIFIVAVIGGLTSLTGAVLATALIEWVRLFGTTYLFDNADLLVTGPGLLLMLLFLPGGLAQVVFGIRDRFLRRVAVRRGLVVPSLVADGLVNRDGERPSSPTPDAAGAATRAPGGAEPLLVCRGVEVAYDSVQVLFGVDLEVERGEIVALLGTNGAGKSTLLRAISQLVQPIAGAITLEGDEITRAGPVRVAEAGVVQVPGGRSVFPTLTVAEHFRVGTWLYRREDSDRLRQRLDEVLEQFPRLRERWDQRAGDLSGGEQQQLALGMAFLAEPKLLIIDELSLGLAPNIVEQLLEMVRRIHAQGCSVILVEQSVNVALTIADRAYFMEKGEVRFSGPVEALFDRDDVLRAVFLTGSEALPQRNGRVRARRASDNPATPEPVGDRPELSVSNLVRRFGGITAVDDVSFDVRQTQVLGLIGPNGAGKTTIFDLISGVLAPDSGRVSFNADNVTAWSPHRRAMAGLGRSFQDARIFPSLTVAENLAIGLERHLGDRDHAAALFALPAVQEMEDHVAFTVSDLIELMNLGAYREKFVSELSTGTRRIVELTMTIAHEPSVLLLDEPSSGIAQRETEELVPLLRRIHEEIGCALLVIEHDIPLISAVSDELIALDLGRVLARGTPAEVLADPRVVSSYLGGDERVINRSGARRRGRRGPRVAKKVARS